VSSSAVNSSPCASSSGVPSLLAGRASVVPTPAWHGGRLGMEGTNSSTCLTPATRPNECSWRSR
jgi:hypothetical protein